MVKWHDTEFLIEGIVALQADAATKAVERQVLPAPRRQSLLPRPDGRGDCRGHPPRVAEMIEHTEACWAMPTCTVCGLRKKPRGRSAPLEMANGLCSSGCPGYDQEPNVGHFWPGESADDEL